MKGKELPRNKCGRLPKREVCDKQNNNNGQIAHTWSHGQEVKTSPFHGGIRGSIPLGTTTFNLSNSAEIFSFCEK